MAKMKIKVKASGGPVDRRECTVEVNPNALGSELHQKIAESLNLPDHLKSKYEVRCLYEGTMAGIPPGFSLDNVSPTIFHLTVLQFLLTLMPTAFISAS